MVSVSPPPTYVAFNSFEVFYYIGLNFAMQGRQEVSDPCHRQRGGGP